MIKTIWDKQSHGWYTSPHLGDICLEPDGKWWWLPRSLRKIETGGLSVARGHIGPFETLRMAKDAAEERIAGAIVYPMEPIVIQHG